MDKSIKFKTMLKKAIKLHPLEFKHFDQTKNIQSQLQEMVQWKKTIKEGNTYILDIFTAITRAAFEREKHALFNTMEQIWLAYVIVALFNQRWNGRTWY